MHDNTPCQFCVSLYSRLIQGTLHDVYRCKKSDDMLFIPVGLKDPVDNTVHTLYCDNCDVEMPSDYQYAYCESCQETKYCRHNVLLKNVCPQCCTDSDFAYDTWRERR
jgi:hypothetical protein